jgi:HK97 family phage portal protein
MSWRDWFRRPERKYTTLDLFREVFGGRSSSAGIAVNWDVAIGVSTVFACARVIADGLAQVPLKLYQESADGRKRTPARAHPLYDLLHRRPNAVQTSFEFRQTLGLHLTLTNNAYCLIERAPGSGRILMLTPLDPKTVSVKRAEDWSLGYELTDYYGKRYTAPPSMIWHIKGPAWATHVGLDAVNLARNAIGLSLAAEDSQAKFHKNGAKPSGVLSVEGVLNPTQYQQLVEFVKKTAGDESGAPMILDRAAKWLSTAMTGVDAQHLETRRYQVEEICRAFRVMPIMVGYSDKAATYASAEQMFLAHVVHTLAPWYECIEQSIDVHLLSERDRANGLYAKFVEEGLLRGASKDTAEVLDKYVNGGLMTPNEGRAKLDLDAMDDPEADKLRVPANIVGKEPATTEEPGGMPPKEDAP